LKVLITGGAGFIGSNFVRRVIDGSLEGFSSITVLDKLTYAGTLSNFSPTERESFEFVRGDICDQELIGKLTKHHTAVINFAAESHVDKSISKARDFIATNVLGTQTLLDSARSGSVETFVQISTDEVYGSIKEGSWDEFEPLLPNSPYAASKASADLIARSYHQTHGLDVRITRSSNNYGPNQFPEKIIPLFITNIIDGKQVPLYGNGVNVRDWVHVDDHCRAIHKVLKYGQPGEIYNIGGGHELSNINLTQKILNLLAKDSSSISYVKDRQGHDLRYSVNYKKISDQIGFRNTVDFETGLRETVSWYLENESWWRPLKGN